jgi:hypothetical protein
MKHRRSEMTQDKQGLLAGLGGTLIGSKFHEQDEVGVRDFFTRTIQPDVRLDICSGSTAKSCS